MSPPRRRPRTYSRLSLFFGSLVLLSGCGQQTPTSPVAVNGYAFGAADRLAPALEGAFFPLAIGNHWHATSEFHVEIVPLQGPPFGEMTVHGDIARALVGTETIFGRPYVVMEETTVESSLPPEESQPFTNWIRYRQDAPGLYEADVVVSTPPVLDGQERPAPLAGAANVGMQRNVTDRIMSSVPADQVSAFASAVERVRQKAEIIQSAFHRGVLTQSVRSGGLLSGEITRLRYPLRPGATWTIRPYPLFAASVEGVEALDLPAGKFSSYRIRVDSEFFGPPDIVHVWVSRSGQLAFRYHLESIATDVDGNELGKAMTDYDEVVDEVALTH